MIAIVNYGSGNIQAIADIYKRLGVDFRVVSDSAGLQSATKIILPGVGAFDQVMGALNQSDMRETLDRNVREDGKPVLGICVGMQLLAQRSDEGALPGLGWLDAAVRRFDRAQVERDIHLPHMGWNTVEPTREHYLFDGVDMELGYYFLHSYYMECAEPSDILAESEYGLRFTSVVQHGHVHGVQFHPEKSHQAGVQLLRNFALHATS